MSIKQQNARAIVEWCPHDSGLFAVGTDSLSLYECQGQRDVTKTLLYEFGNTGQTPSIPIRTTQRRNKDFFRMLQTDNEISQVKSMQWCPLPKQLIAAGVGAGKIVVSDFNQTVVELLPQRSNTSNSGSSTMLTGSVGHKTSRPSLHANVGCNTVAWNRHNPNQIAAGFERVRSDCCAFVWDVSTQVMITSIASTPRHVSDILDYKVNTPSRSFSMQNSKPTIINELANSEAIVAMAWLPSEPSCLATGTGFKWLRIYDIRTKLSPISVNAHSSKGGVFGVVFDIHRPHMLATYSDDSKEPVKIWDIRSIQASRSDRPNTPIVSIYPSGKSISQIAWSPTQAGILATTSPDERSIALWDVENQIQFQSHPSAEGLLQIRKPFKRRSTKEPVFAFSWQADAVQKTDTAQESANPNRLLISTTTGKLENVSIHDTMPLAISSHGSMGFASGNALFGGELEANSTSIAAQMIRRVKKGYSMNVLKSLQLFVKDDDARDLRFVWQWVEQVEALRRLSITQMEVQSRESRGVLNNASSMSRGHLRAWPVDPKALVSAGVQHLLGLSKVPSTVAYHETSLRDPVLGCLVYDSLGRRTALLACQWDPECGQPVNLNLPRSSSAKTPLNSQSGSWLSLHDESEAATETPVPPSAMPTLQSLMQQCESTYDFDRAAALAVFHGDLQAAVAVLQRGAESPVESPTRDVRQLVAMAVAGYSIGNSGPLWGTMCQQLIKRPEIQSKTTPRYLHAICTFLVLARDLSAATHAALPARLPRSSTGSFGARRPSSNAINTLGEEPQLFTVLLQDESLLLSDRTAFACRFLPLDALTRFIDGCVDSCVRQGNLQGLLLVGLEPAILQEYLDRTGDIQTVALLAARVTYDELSIFAKWITVYRDLLNQWELFHQRALFDVGRAQLEGQLNGFRDMALALNPNALMPDRHQSSATSGIAPQLYVRCNFCGTSLALSSLLRVGAGDWLMKAKPKLNNCPSCKKPLPQCALCLLPFGTLNPYLELAMRRGEKKGDLDTSAGMGTDNLSELSSIPFVEWFTWCQTCKHGGHAHHMADWFETHDVCPVSDCDCQCNLLDAHTTPTPPKPQPEIKETKPRSPTHMRSMSLPRASLPPTSQLENAKSPSITGLSSTYSGLGLSGASF